MPDYNRIAGFVQEFASYADRAKGPYIPVWMEVLDNYLLSSPGTGIASDTKYPLSRGGDSAYRAAIQGGSFSSLRSPETHNAIEALLAKLMLVLFPAGENWVAAQRRGREDALAAETVTRLLKYGFEQRNHYRVMYTALKSMLLTGTSIVQLGWKLVERPRTFRQAELGIGGLDTVKPTRIPRYPVYDDVAMRNVDIMDFLPDPGADNLEDMVAAARHLTVNASEARRRAHSGMYDKQAVEEAIVRGASAEAAAKVEKSKNTGWQAHKSVYDGVSFQAYGQMKGLEFWGEVPTSVTKYESGEQWRVITVLQGVVVRDRPWPLDDYRLPFYDLTINPIEGRFWGMSPGESIRYQQDFLDFLLCMMADSVVRSVHPPMVYNRDDEIDIAKLMAWDPDVPIASERPGDIRTLQYSGDKFSAFNMYAQVTGDLRSNAGAEGGIQGRGLGINRASATEAARTFEFALDRPELAARYIEQECLRPIGRGYLTLYQQNLVSNDEVQDRIGVLPSPVPLADINADWDVSFVGSRNYETKRSRMQAIDRVVSLLSIPQFANWLPLDDLGLEILDGFGFDELAQKAGTQETVMKNLAMAQLLAGMGIAQGPANGNGETLAIPGGTAEQQIGDILS